MQTQNLYPDRNTTATVEEKESMYVYRALRHFPEISIGISATNTSNKIEKTKGIQKNGKQSQHPLLTDS